jgi:hypothetical protein
MFLELLDELLHSLIVVAEGCVCGVDGGLDDAAHTRGHLHTKQTN